MATIAPIHPGEVLLEEFLAPLGVTQHRLAVSIGAPPRRITEIVHGPRSARMARTHELQTTHTLNGTCEWFEFGACLGSHHP